jgi:hypothetical protein
MVLGMSLPTYTLLHVIISLLGLVSGVAVMWGLVKARALPGSTMLFLVTTVLTSITGFLFPQINFDPADGVGVISLVVLTLAILGLYMYRRTGKWRVLYVVNAVIAFYLNAFVGVVQSFGKIPFLRALAPTQTEAPFVVAQGVLFALFVWIGVLAVKRYHVGELDPAAHAGIVRA